MSTDNKSYQALTANEDETAPQAPRRSAGGYSCVSLMIAMVFGFILGVSAVSLVVFPDWSAPASSKNTTVIVTGVIPPTKIPPTQVPPTQVPPTQSPPTQTPPTQVIPSTAIPPVKKSSTARVIKPTAVAPSSTGEMTYTCEAIPEGRRLDCGYMGITEAGCSAKGCCWAPSSGAWCYYKYPAPPAEQCFKVSQNNLAAPFSDAEVEKMKGYFFANIDIQGKGGVVAAPDHTTGPGGDYYWHWMRDSALTMKTVYEMYPFSEVEGKLKNYVSFLINSQYRAPIHSNTDPRAEPKYILPNGEIFPDGWCRPQPDGAGLTAITMILLADKLIEKGDSAYVKQYLWTGSSTYQGGLIKYELDWLVNNWGASGCDLWEEFTSNAFFWNRINYKRAFVMGAKFAEKMGDTATAATYRAKGAAVNDTLLSHWNGEYVFECSGREKDTAVIIGFTDGYVEEDKLFNPSSLYCASTVQMFNDLFCSDYAINKKDTAAGIAGILYGRYKGDTYNGGNPWHLLSAGLSVLLYRAAKEVLTNNALPAADATAKWAQVFGVDGFDSPKALATTMALGADGVLERIRYHIKDQDFHCYEQIERSSGAQTSAHDLTWSYAMVLSAMSHRKELMAMM